MIVTFDNNCIIAIENGEEPNSSTLREIAHLCRLAGHSLAVYSYLFLENRPLDSKLHDVANFQRRMEAIAIGQIETLRPAMNTPLIERVNSILFPAIHFYHHDYLAAKCANEQIPLRALEEANRDRYPFRFPASPAEAQIPLPETLDAETKKKLRRCWEKWSKKWNNTRSDVLALCAHVTWALDGIFVTADEDDFISRRDKLREVVATLRIMTPKEAYAALRQESDG